MKKFLAIAGIAVLVTSVAAAEVSPSKKVVADSVTGLAAPDTPGTIGSLTITAVQTGPLQAQINASVTTAGGNGVPRTFNTGGGGTVVLDDIVWLYAQIYDSPWQGGCTFWATPGPNWCDFGSQQAINTPNASLNVSFTTTVPAADNYQLFALAVAGATWPTPNYLFGYVDTTASIGPTGTLYIGQTQVPTSTPPPATTGEPVPSLNTYGIIAMVVLLVGVAILVMWRRS
ncbi:MAG TPA: hypothetical protein VLB51_04025 [Methylomirabilota bacterium]|nr:hypothetical protein [Methylomirabilota bacterium]